MRSTFFLATILFSVFLMLLSGSASLGKAVDEPGPGLDASAIGEILKNADQSRGNLDGITWEVSVESAGTNGGDRMVFDVKARGFDTLATSLSPPKDKGNKILMVNGNMWFYKPGLSKPVPISTRQKLMGNASYGDIAATNYYRDYDATLAKKDTIDQEACYVFDLKAKTTNATYEQIRYWISIRRNVGLKAQYFTVSGKKIKSARMYYNKEVDFDGTRRPFISDIHITDAITKGDTTILKFDKPALAALPNHIFNRNLLRN
jgi:outer membrane lipoprotein-sorting protein